VKKTKFGFKTLAKRITGISLPVFGVSWNPPMPERDIVRETFIFLEDCGITLFRHKVVADKIASKLIGFLM
jgi:hypothetical protein